MPDDDLTDDHMRLLLWLDAHPTGSLVAAAQALGMAITEVEGLCADLGDARGRSREGGVFLRPCRHGELSANQVAIAAGFRTIKTPLGQLGYW